MTVQIYPHPALLESKYLLLRAIAILAPISAAEYAWIVLRRVQTQSSHEPQPEGQAS
jgi:cardiolipin synthase